MDSRDRAAATAKKANRPEYLSLLCFRSSLVNPTSTVEFGELYIYTSIFLSFPFTDNKFYSKSSARKIYSSYAL